MGAGGGRGEGMRYMNKIALLFFLTFSPTAVDACLWCVSIDESPAPLPQDGPPFSAHAIRDRALLPYQIIGVAAAYVGFVLIAGTLLLTVGRKMRNHAQSMSSRPLEMIKPVHKAFEPSPISPVSTRSWYPLRTKASMAGSMGNATDVSPAIESVASFDNHVLEADRARMQSEMERLYAAVMKQDEGTIEEEKEGPHAVIAAPPAPPKYVSRNPTTSDPSLRHLQPSQAVPQTPRSPMRPIYPPVPPTSEPPFSPTTPIDAEPQNWPGSPAFQTRINSPLSGRSIKLASPSSHGKLRKGVRNLTISPPVPRPLESNDDGARTPLSPLAYANPGIPPEPPTARSIAPPLETPATERMFPLYARDEDDEARNEDTTSSPPRAQPPTPRVVTNFSKPVPPIPSGAAGTRTLPFREMNRQHAAAQAQSHSQSATNPNPWPTTSKNPLSPSGTGAGGYLTSAGPVKTTFVEARRDRLMLGALRTGMATPYSPYMPFTPVTPITPHLTSRMERKQRAKEERSIRGAITEEDAVAGEEEIWGSAY